jgi:hypothetical protein
MDILIGADPELFVKDVAGRNISGHDMIPGNKRRPHPVKKGAVQVDGTALEFNIVPAKTEEEFVENIRTVLGQLKGMIPAGHTLALEAVAKYEEEYFRNLPDAVKAMGCDPDFDAYTGVEIAHKGVDRPMRTAAGHIHIGWTKDEDPFTAKHYQSCRTLTKELDIWLGLPSVIFDQESNDRRSMYGKAGSFRPKPYGCEYRVLSNKWLQSDEMTKWAFAQTKRAFEYLMAGRHLHGHLNHATIQSAINNSNVDLATKCLKTLGSTSLIMPDGSDFAPKRRQAAEPKKSMLWQVVEEDMQAARAEADRQIVEAAERAHQELRDVLAQEALRPGRPAPRVRVRVED